MFTLIRSIPAVRSLFWRFGRKLYRTARGEVANEPSMNGEYWLLGHVLESVPAGTNPVLLDVGANKGNWTAEALRLSRPGREIRVHAFEPCAQTRGLLADRLSDAPSVRIHSCALSDIDGDGVFYSSEEGAGTNSLNEISGPNKESVKLRRLDSWRSAERIDSVTMIKIDTEGFDFLVLKGAESALKQGAVEIIQFEYNWRWLLNHASLRDVFRLIEGKPYRFGKLVGPAIEFYDEWHFELDRYFESNYVLVRKESPVTAIGRTIRFSASNAPL